MLDGLFRLRLFESPADIFSLNIIHLSLKNYSIIFYNQKYFLFPTLFTAGLNVPTRDQT